MQAPKVQQEATQTTVDTNFNGGVPIASLTLALKPFIATAGNTMSNSMKLGL
jgi:hypothetical protein